MPALQIDEWIALGQDCGQGNLLAVQPCLRLEDYASPDALYACLAAYLSAAHARGWLNPRTVAVFPEYTGAWLVAVREGKGVFQASALQPAMAALALAHPFAFLRSLASSREKDRLAAGLFRLKAGVMAAAYTRVFSSLARDFSLTLVAGSILLPRPSVSGGQVLAGSGPLENISAVFGPDGLAHPRLARKCYPIQAELPFLAPARVIDLPVFETPAGRLGVLVCADSWFPPAYAALQAQGIRLLAVPSYINHSGAWDQPWGGYSGWPAPADVDPADIGRLSEGGAWRKYALAGRLASSGARFAVNAFFQGALWDMGSDGRSLAVAGGLARETTRPGPALLNVWLE